MVAHMLALTRGEHGQLPVRTEPVALDELVQRIWRGCAPRAAARDLHINVSLDSAQVMADPALLGSIVTNLCDNAVDYTPPGGEIQVGVEAQDGRVALRITNTTADLESADVSRLFDRFWRKEKARSDGHGGQRCPTATDLRAYLAASTGLAARNLSDLCRLALTQNASTNLRASPGQPPDRVAVIPPSNRSWKRRLP